MKKWKKRLQKGIAYLLMLSMVLSTSGIPTLAVNASEGITVSDSCEHHTEHNEDCGYIEATEGSPCTHEHDDSCYAEETGGETKTLNCQHTHDENCGYVEAVEGHPCAFACTDCVECTCDTDDETIHATNCPAYVAPENPECFCVEKCTEETANVWCDVCGFDYTACKGEESVALYADGCAHETVENGICTACSMYGWCGALDENSAVTDSITWTITGDEIAGYTLTISGTGAMVDYSSPSGQAWKSYGEKIKSIEINDGVTSIGNYAFYGCTSLTSITIPDSVTSIGNYAIGRCESLKSVTIPKDVTSIGDSAFSRCTSLASIVIPDKVKTIGTWAFNSTSITSITIPASVKSIGDNAFCNCTLLSEILVDEGSKAYKSEDGVLISADGTLIVYPLAKEGISYTIPDGVRSIGADAFVFNTTLESVIIPDGITSIGDSAFNECTSLTSVTFPSNLDTIGSYAFWRCEALESITIPDGLNTIGAYAFAYCESLTSVTFPASVTSLGERIFDDASNLYEITFLGKTSPSGSNVFRYSSVANVIVSDDYESDNFCGVSVVNEHFDAKTGKSNLTHSVAGNTITVSCNVCDYEATATLKVLEPDESEGESEGSYIYDGTNKAYIEYSDNWTSGTVEPIPSDTSAVNVEPGYNITKLKSEKFGEIDLGEENGVSFIVNKGAYDFIIDISEGNVIIGADTISYGNNKTIPHESGMEIVIMGTTTSNTVTVKSGVSANITLADVNISVSQSAFKIEDNSTGNVRITLADGTTNILKSSSGCGIQKNGIGENIGTLTIQGGELGSGSLDAIGGGYSNAGIGGSAANASTSKITISGGTVTAQGGNGGAGIGGGEYGSCSNITISGGTVTAKGGSGGAGIGAGYHGDSASVITISNATVIATGGNYASGIGADWNGEVSTVKINNSIVTATGGCDAYGIGGGHGASNIIIKGVSSVKTAGEDGGIRSTPTNETVGVHLFTIANPNNENIKINGNEYPKHHSSDDTNVYAYLPEKTAIEVTVGDETTKYIYDTVNSTWLEAVEVDIPIAPTKTFTYDGTEQTYEIEESNNYTISGNKQTNAGTYYVTVTPNVNVVWSNGTNEVKKYVFVINPAEGTGSVTMDDWTYDGTAKTPNPSSATNGTDNVTYLYESTDGKGYSSSVAPTNAGSYRVTATFAATKNYNACTATATFTIAKVTNYIGTVSAEAVSDTLDPSAVTLNRSDESVAGELALTDSTLAWGKTTYNWQFTPSDTDNYEILTGTVKITIKDTAEPEIKYQVKENGWKKFFNTITLGLFCDDYKDLTIKCTDATSGVKEVRYYISVNGLTEAEEMWITVLGAGEHEVTITENLTERGDYVIYVKASDNAGKDASIAWERILLYENSKALEEARNIEITYGDTADKTSMVTLNGNTIKEIKQGGTALTENTDYTIDYNDGTATITLKGTYLSTLDANTEGYEFTVSYHPLGIAEDETIIQSGSGTMPADTTFKVVVNTKELTVTGATATDRYYDTTDEVEITAVTLTEAIAGDTVSVDVTDLKGTLNSSNAGNYTKVTLPTLTLTGTDAANYTLVQPTEEVALSSEITIAKLTPTIDVPTETFADKTFGDAAFDLGVTENNTDENGKLTYTSSDEAVVTVDENGKVTIKGAGDATITVTLAETTNYNEAESKTITVKVAKKAYSVDAINKKYLNTKDNADSIDLSALLPRDCGTVTYDPPQTNGDVTCTVAPSIMDEGILSYTVASGEVGATGTITVTVSTQNYEDITITVNVELNDKIPVELQEGSSVTLKNSVLTYGQTLSELTFKTAVFVDEDGNTVAGTLAWKEPNATPNAGTTSAIWVFTPSNEEYASLEGTVAITVKKATPNVSALPEAADTVYNPNAKLSQISLSEGTVSVEGKWEWQTGDIAPTVNNKGYVAVFKPKDNTNYNEVTRTITVKVTLATPVITNVSGLAITYGDTLSTSTLSGAAQYSSTDSTAVTGSFAWKDGTVKPTVADSNQTAYAVVFTPSDKVNYNTVETTITITVNKAENAPNMPGATMSVSNKYTKIGDVPLPAGWEWVDAVKEISLEVDTPVMATAVYVGTDKGNYEKEKVLITVTRSACDHVAGEILYTGEGEKAPTCTESGLGHKECSKCQTVMESGIVVKALGHTGGTATCKDKAVCTRCKQPYGFTDGSKHGDTELRGYKEATCTSGGYTGDTHCKDCGAKLASGTATAATGHNYSSEVTKQPTTTEEGVRTYTCANCDDSYTEAIPKLPEEEHQHSYTATVTREATCSQTGIKTYTCKCGDSHTETIAKLDHNYTSKVTVEATTDKEGEMTYTCSLCGHSYTKPISKLTDDSSDNGSSDNGSSDNGGTPIIESKAPFIEGADGKMGWDVISDEIDDAKEGDTVVVDMNGSTTVPGDIIEQIKGKDINIVLKLDNGMTWTINGKTVTADNIGDIDFGVKIGSDEAPLNKIPVDVINNVTGERYSMELTLAYDGEFGFEAVLSVEMDAKNAGLYANLFYYNPNTNATEYICADVIDEKGIAELTFTHASDYLIVIDDVDMGIEDTMADVEESATAEESMTDVRDTAADAEAPTTEDNSWRIVWIIVIGAVVLVIGGITFFVVKRRRKEE